jgi:hypothetical protein
MKPNEDGHRILAEARANVERLRDSERRFEAEREELEALRSKSTASNEAVERPPHIESRNERHRREIDEQEEQFERERRQMRREERREKQADWSQWENWVDAKIANAIAEERRMAMPIMAEEVKAAINLIYDELMEDVKAVRKEIMELRSTMDQLRSMVRAESAKVIDLPNPLRRAN